MLRVKTRLGLSRIEGIGLFADEFIPAGTVTWAYAPGLDGLYTEADLARMTPISRAQFLKYAYHDKTLDRYVLCFDDQRFINHEGNDPNIHSTPSQDVAARDIQPGEELTCDYCAYELDWFERRAIDERSFGSAEARVMLRVNKIGPSHIEGIGLLGGTTRG